MAARRIGRRLAACLFLSFSAPALADEAEPELSPHTMLRSLQYVQDSVVLGDHSAAAMQRFMLETIDARLRAADRSVFDDPRNVDAALIYAMSGGNPGTLEYLAARDLPGNFDGRVAEVLRAYLSGRGATVSARLVEVAREYRDEPIGPYLALVAGNVLDRASPDEALHFYDRARLTAPGTIVEEAALRRAMAICVDTGKAGPGLLYARNYARRFIHSPFAGQFADLFVQFAIGNDIAEQDLQGVADAMDIDRRRETYLRIARAGVIAGKPALARFAAERVKELGPAPESKAMASLYGGLAEISGGGDPTAVRAIAGLPDELLPPRDRALRDAATAIAAQVVTAPAAEIPAVVERAVSQPEVPSSLPGTGSELESFVEQGRSRLAAIDEMLREEKLLP